MKHDETNINVLKQLQEYAQLYFEAIVELHTVDGVCSLKPGKYSAAEMEDNSYKSVFGHAYALPTDAMFDEVLTVEAGAFQCSFCYRDIFKVLAKWEGMAGAGKQKAVFEVGNVDEKSAKVLLKETTELGRYKEKRIRVQRVAGNWWAPRKVKRNECQIPLYYELNGVMFMPGREVYGEDDLHSDSTKAWCERFDDAWISEQLLKAVENSGDAGGYLQEVANRAGLTMPQAEEAVQQPETAAETPRISTEAAEATECTAEGEKREISPICDLYKNTSEGEMPELDAMLYYNWHSNAEKHGYRTITEKALAVALTNIFLATMRSGKGHVLAMNNRGELIDTTFDLSRYLPQPPKIAPQSPQTAPTDKRTTAPPKHCQRPREQPKMALRRCRLFAQSEVVRTAAHRSIILPPPGIWAAANSPPRHPTLTSAAKHKQPQ